MVQAEDTDSGILVEKLKKISTLQGRFEQRFFDKKGDLLAESSGVFFMKKPGFFHWNTEKPASQLVIGSPEKLWFYEPDIEQVTIRKQNLNAVNNPARLLTGNFTEFDRFFKVSSEKTKNKGMVFTLDAIGKNKDVFPKVLFGFNRKTIERVTFFDTLGQKTELSFLDVKRNKKVDMGLFEFIIPEGVDVISDFQ